MYRQQNLIVFAKEPRIGAVKTRLAKDIGHVQATFWYRNQLQKLFRRIGSTLSCNQHLFLSPRKSSRYFKPYAKNSWNIHYQGTGDLGQRMKTALCKVGSGPTILVGSDIPALSKKHIKSAFALLNKTDVVFGPAEDGGYWLIGLSRFTKAPNFHNIRWSTEYALSDTMEQFSKGHSIGLLEKLKDVDSASDLNY